MSQPSDPGPEGRPQAWSPPAATPRAGIGRFLLLGLGLAFAGFLGFTSLQMFRSSQAEFTAPAPVEDVALAHRSFDPAHPPGPIDPVAAIEAYAHERARNEAAPEDVRRAIDGYAGRYKPAHIDDHLSRAGVGVQGRHIFIDYRVKIRNPHADMAVARARLKAEMSARHIADICAAENAADAQFLREHGVTTVHVYTMNDGNPPLFVEIPPQNCGA